MRGSAALPRARTAVAALAMMLGVSMAATGGGCSGDDDPARSGVTCEQACAKCSVGDICADCAGVGMRFRDEFEDALYACVVNEATCKNDWEACVASAIAGAPARDLDRTFRDACLARRTECQNQGTGFADDPCLTSGAFVTSIVGEAQQCLAKACSEISSCMNGAFR